MLGPSRSFERISRWLIIKNFELKGKVTGGEALHTRASTTASARRSGNVKTTAATTKLNYTTARTNAAGAHT